MKNLIEGFIIETLKFWLNWNNLKLLNIKKIDIDKMEHSKKKVNHNNSLLKIAISIQPEWVIKENAINLRNEVWFNPPMAPTIIDKIKEIKIKLQITFYEINNKGNYFLSSYLN